VTVADLLARLAAAFPAFNARAVEAWAPVFRARFGHREGAALAEAYAETLGAFSVAKSKSLFPLPADFELHLPNRKPIRGDAAAVARLLAERHARASRLFAAWHAAQGLKIKAARPQAVFAACVLEAMERCRGASDATERILLGPDDIALCESRAISAARVHRFGRLPATNQEWQSQCDELRGEEVRAA